MTNRLLVMRLADMHKVHPRQDNTRVCAHCGVQVGIYPSGQAALRADPSIEIVCQQCVAFDPERAVPAAEPAVIIEEAKESGPA